MSDNFDPDAYLAENPDTSSDFDPDAYLSAPAESAPAEESSSEELPELNRAEALAVSTGQGVGFGLTPILSGAVGAGMNAVEQIGDKLGLTTDSELEKQGFTQPDKKSGLEGLMQAYYDSRDSQKQHQEAAHEQYPVQSIGANIVGGIGGTLATAPLAAGSKIASAVLPSAANLGKASLTGKALMGAKEGLKAGALNGFGEGDAKLLEGEFADTAKEVAETAVGGALVGGALPYGIAGAKFLGGVAKAAVPGLKPFNVGRKLGVAGADVTQESVDKISRQYSEDLTAKIQSVLTESSVDKQTALTIADEMNVRINAGEDFDKVIDDIFKKGATPGADKVEKDLIVKTLRQLKGEVENKTQSKLDTNAAKNIQKIKAKYPGAELDDTQELNDYVQDLVPGTDSEAKLLGLKQTFKVPGKDKTTKLLDVDGNEMGTEVEKTFKDMERIVQQVEQPEGVPVINYDTQNLKLSENERLIKELNRMTGYGDSNPIKGQDNIAMMKELAGTLRTKSDKAFEANDQTGDINKNLRNIFGALKKAGVEVGDAFSDNRFDKEALADTLEQITTSDGNRKTAARFFEALKEIDPKEFSEFQDQGKFIKDANKLANQAEGTLQSSNWFGSLFGSGVGMVGKAGNFVGKNQGAAQDAIKPFVQSATKFYGTSQQGIADLAAKVEIMPGPLKQYATVLNKAAASDDRKRAAILYGLYQQPAFREMYQSLGESIIPELDATTDKMNNQLLNKDEEN